eukprot:6969833-Alexandrium_andersonii.AAC.1
MRGAWAPMAAAAPPRSLATLRPTPPSPWWASSPPASSDTPASRRHSPAPLPGASALHAAHGAREAETGLAGAPCPLGVLLPETPCPLAIVLN